MNINIINQTGALSTRQRVAVQFFHKRGETHEYISNLLQISIYSIRSCLNEKSYTKRTDPSHRQTLKAWHEFRKQKGYDEMYVMDTTYLKIKEAFCAGFEINH